MGPPLLAEKFFGNGYKKKRAEFSINARIWRR
jgi:hypothetical protein